MSGRGRGVPACRGQLFGRRRRVEVVCVGRAEEAAHMVQASNTEDHRPHTHTVSGKSHVAPTLAAEV